MGAKKEKPPAGRVASTLPYNKRSLLPLHAHSSPQVQWPSQVWLCNPMDCSTPGLPVPHHLPEFAQVHVHCFSDAVQPSHPLMPSSPTAFSLSQHQVLFQWVICSHQMTKILELQLQHQSFQWIFRLTGLISWLSEGLSGVFSRTTAQKHHFFDIWPSLWFSSHSCMWPLGRPQPLALNIQTFVSRVVSLLFNTLSRFAIAFLPRSNHLLTSCLQSPFAGILEPKKRVSYKT